jgi:DNA polymerase III sliding clamp (beta) subunit (PCNA family)
MMSVTTINGVDVSTVTVLSVGVTPFREVCSVVVAAGTDQRIPVLMGVLLEWDAAGALTTVCTDRFRLAVATTPGEPTVCEPGACLVPAKQLTEYVKGLPKGRDDGRYVVTIAPAEGAVTLSCVTLDGEHTRTIRTLDGEFPRYASLVPTAFEGLDGDGIGCNPQYLADVAKMPHEKGARVTVRFNGGTRPMVWEGSTRAPGATDRVTWTYLLMPMRASALS